MKLRRHEELGAGMPVLTEDDIAVLNNYADYLKLLERGRNGD